MEIEKLRTLLEEVKGGEIAVDDALQSLRTLPFEDLGFSKIDHHRQLRTGFPEVIFCQGKTVEHVKQISERILAAGHPLLATRATPDMYEAVKAIQPAARYNALGRTISVSESEEEGTPGILVVSAGTSDLPVAEEAAETVLMMGNSPERLYDVGVAGLHRLISNHEKLLTARVIIVIAGMEGALPSVVGGLVDCPVIAVPTSIGYGASFGGLAALLGMLNSCASGVTVVNIDNGFGAGYSASLINRLTT
ncbi:nickel pincer cofactor biosynthesis protein LarB [Candidatus Poribacteria bacterium]|nr:nickel pincer cofactor biosynthesis protein LarB [Candidatus Poribacteria bacterium]MYH82676.1 nickel pincer cofactor biosynthesis protein LarB [Candidatus Poribacteria bacterium]MYK95246.1 nickel pincer cofactor biosynthesis protein LarB [Candidatus Poribacteria bacterium]